MLFYCVIFSCRSNMTQSRLFMIFVEWKKNEIKFKKHNWRYYQIQRSRYACIYISKITSLSFHQTTTLLTYATSQMKIKSGKKLLCLFYSLWYTSSTTTPCIYIHILHKYICCHPIVYRWNFRDNISLAAGGW